MKRWLLGLVLLAAPARMWAEDVEFSQTLSPEDFKTTGLDRLTPAERQRLDERIASFKRDAVAAAQRSAMEAFAAKQAAEAEAKTAKAGAAESKAGGKGFFAKARVLVAPGTQIEYADIKSTILGKFDGWEERTIFHLANGQHWQVANGNDRYYTPAQDNTEVEIHPSALGSFWMYVPSVRSRVRVTLLENK